MSRIETAALVAFLGAAVVVAVMFGDPLGRERREPRPPMLRWNATDAEYEAHVARQRGLIGRGADRSQP